MAGSTTPGAVHSTYVFNNIISGPLSWITQAQTQTPSGQTAIKAIWRNEIGTATAPSGQAHA